MPRKESLYKKGYGGYMGNDPSHPLAGIIFLYDNIPIAAELSYIVFEYQVCTIEVPGIA